MSCPNISCFADNEMDSVTFCCCFWFNTTHDGHGGYKVLRKYSPEVSAHVSIYVTCIGRGTELAGERYTQRFKGEYHVSLAVSLGNEVTS